MLTKFVHYPFLFHTMYIDVPTFIIDEGISAWVKTETIPMFSIVNICFFKHESFSIVLF